ncbi:hypothetical protein D7B24_004410 [Verticillium nonalfalfae]|uniref:Uncharacterized protein n=1 Tax=Verticillium nonalfalfae TaxID=1051616 RepID=A0A3M9XYC1_9PEZI|nr:uncharacterized protein D7B24_004410 [Verticillium nonalfalfae]RNJ52088.1 hypothetical protein D7B24_004410 [Verticillium nonalfalfae]
MSSTSPSVAATVTALLALTTPFVAPPGCPRFTTTSIHDTSSIDGVAAVLVADDPSCYPDGWADVVPESRMRFSPGVCPSGWVYYGMGRAGAPAGFTAACCDSGYTLINFEHNELVASYINDGCGRWTSRLNTDTGLDNATITGSTLLVHRALAITWQASDIPTLTPQPPSITSGMRVPTWTPGEVIPDGKYDRYEDVEVDNNQLPASLYMFICIGIPLISFSCICSCVVCCVRSSKKKKTARRAAALQATAGGGNVQSENK